MGNPRFSSSTPARVPVVDRSWLPLEPGWAGAAQSNGSRPRAVSSEVPLIRKKWGYYAQGFDLCFHPRQLDFFQPENFVSILHESTPLKNLRSIRSLCAFDLDSGKMDGSLQVIAGHGRVLAASWLA